MTCFYFEDEIYQTADDVFRTLDRAFNGRGYVEVLDMSYKDACEELDRMKDNHDEHVFSRSRGSVYVTKRNRDFIFS